MPSGALQQLLSSPEEFDAASAQDREQALALLKLRLGDAWSTATTYQGERILMLTHVPTQLEFVVVPGGDFCMGLREEDIEEASEYVDWTSDVASYVEQIGASARPARRVTVRPFLCARTLLGRVGLSREEASSCARQLGFRLISEAELEWLLRDGGKEALMLGAKPVPGKPGFVVFRESRFGVEDPLVPQWADDDWYPSAAFAPANSEPRHGGDVAGVCRSTAPFDAFVSEQDIVCLLAALRTKGSPNLPCAARLVQELPSLV